MFMISTDPEHSTTLVLSGKSNRNDEEILMPDCFLAYKNDKTGADVSDQMSSYYSSLRRSLKWYRKVTFEVITGISVVNAHVLYNKYLQLIRCT